MRRTDEAEDETGVWRSGRAILIGVRGVMQWQVVRCNWQLEASGPVDAWGERLKTKLDLPSFLQMMRGNPGDGALAIGLVGTQTVGG